MKNGKGKIMILDEPAPRKGENPVGKTAFSTFHNVFVEQTRKGFEKYGTYLMTFNGRNAYHDAMQELVDILMYVTQLHLELQQAKEDIRWLLNNSETFNNNESQNKTSKIYKRWNIERTCDYNLISDGFGNYWSAICPECGQRTMQVVRPGKVQCTNCEGHRPESNLD